MKAAAFIPIKSFSSRVPRKNFAAVAGRPLYMHIIDKAIAVAAFDAVYVDTDSERVAEYATRAGALHIERRAELATDEANGNDLIVHHAEAFPGYDAYFQLFATAPFLSVESIERCVEGLRDASEFDSVMTVVEESGWFWFNRQPVNYRPGLLPRSQDAPTLIRETTGLYGIRRAALLRYGCRIGARPLMIEVDPAEAMDIDTQRDMDNAKAHG